MVQREVRGRLVQVEGGLGLGSQNSLQLVVAQVQDCVVLDQASQVEDALARNEI